MLTLNNPAGLWALLGLPAVLLIHFLQRKSRVLPISTLFLLDRLNRESVSGRRLERLRSSVPLWLQLLMVLMLAWLLVQPRWLEKNSVQRIVVVLDGSASMQAFRETLRATLPQELQRLASAVATTEYVVVDTLLERENRYHGTSLKELVAALDSWTPDSGTHDFVPALRMGRSLAEKDGLVVFVTDHLHEELPFGARLFSIGAPTANVGFAGLAVEEKDGQLVWKTTLKNYAASQQTRQWWTEQSGGQTGRHTVTLEPGQSRNLQGLLTGAGVLTIRCNADAFALDDALPVVRPEPKKLAVLLPVEPSSPGEEQLYRQLFAALPNLTLTNQAEQCHLTVAHYDALQPVLPAGHAIVFVRDARAQLAGLSGEILAEPGSLLEGLNWQSLVCLDATRIPMKPGDEPLLWQGERPLVFLRSAAGRHQLCFNFDLRRSNARKLSAFVILVHRFLERIREQTPLREVQNFECSQKLRLACETGEQAPQLRMLITSGSEAGQSKTIAARLAALLTAPARPGTFAIRQGDTEWLSGACHFADTREADFSGAAAWNGIADAKAGMLERFSREDSHWRVWVLGLLVVLVASWGFVRRSDDAVAAAGPV
ncbi:MAG: BatA and WFA domain-containing protein [Verrucomicrobiales bacterium]|nr:BatA and WFA domain-containing protein [Verrucomicrobiales bacterium]